MSLEFFLFPFIKLNTFTNKEIITHDENHITLRTITSNGNWINSSCLENYEGTLVYQEYKHSRNEIKQFVNCEIRR